MPLTGRGLRALVGLLGVVWLAGGCMSRPPAARAATGPGEAARTSVGRGDRFRVGLVAFDQFFSSLFDLQVELTGVADDRRIARSALTHALGVQPTASERHVLGMLRERVEEAQKAGVRLAAQGGEIRAEGKASADDKALAAALSACVAAERQTAERLDQIPERSESLRQILAVLDGSVGSDLPASRQREVRAELGAARQALASLPVEARSASRDIRSFLDEIFLISTGHKPPLPAPGKRP